MQLTARISAVCVAATVFFSVHGTMRAQDAQPEVRFDHSSVRLLAGTRTADGKLQAGLEIRLQPEWKTYWRMPGDAGIPPSFDWKGSENLKSVAIGWPAPKRYIDEAGETIGYKDHVVFPLTVQSTKPGSAVNLNLTLYYAICKDICIPAKAHVALGLTDSGNGADSALIDAFRKQIPRAAGSEGMKIKEARVETSEGKHSLVVEVADGDTSAKTDIFVEGFDDAYFRKPEKEAKAAYRMAIDGLGDPAELKGRTLKLTLLSGNVRLVQDVTIR